MALPTITLVNLTAGDIDLTQLAVTVPASSSEIVSDFNFTDEILNDDELQTELGAGNLRIDITGGGLSSSDTTKTLEQSRSLIKPLHDLDIKHNLAGTTAPIATDDEDAGYSVGSIWVDETNDNAYICVDASAAAAIWDAMGGGAATWAETLVAGQISGGTDPVISSGDTLRGVDNSSTVANAFDLDMRGGNQTALTGNVQGGAVNIDGGSTLSTNGSAQGGDVNVTSGGAIGASGAADSGTLRLRTPTPTNFNGTSGQLIISTGDGGTGGGNANAGTITILTGDGQGAGLAGSINISCGLSPLFGSGGSISLTAGETTGSASTGGAINITAGQGGRSGGDVFITGGLKDISSANFETGSVTIQTGSLTGTGDIGSINLIVSAANTPASDNTEAGSINLTVGAGGVRSADGGHITLTAGDTNTFGSGFVGGTVFLIAGDNVNGTTNAEGGSIVATPGTGNVTDGMFKIQGSSTMEMTERAAVISGIVGGEGRWWVRDDTPNVPMFTDDAGTDWVLNEIGSTGLQEAYEIVNTIVTSAPEGIFSVTGTEEIILSSSTSDASLSALNVNITALGATAAGDITLTGSTASGPGQVGGDILFDAGDGNTTGTGGAITGIAGTGGATGAGGIVSWTGGAGGATNSLGGAASLTGGLSTGTANGAVVNVVGGAAGATGALGGKASLIGGAGGATSGTGGTAAVSGGSPTDGDGGAVNIVGTAGVGTNRSGGVVTIDAGNSTGTAAGAAVSITAGDGSVSSVGGDVNIDGGLGRTGGNVVITSGAPIGALEAGDVRIIAAKGGGVAGKILLITESDDATTAPVIIDTQSGFADQGENRRTFGRSETIAASTSNQSVVDLGSIASNGDQLRVQVKLTAVDSVTKTDLLSFRFDGDFYRDAGTVFAGAVFQNSNIGAGAFFGGVGFSVAISGGTIQLHLSNTDLVGYTLLISSTFITQLGGAAA